MKGRYELRSVRGWKSFKYTNLEYAQRGLIPCVPAGEWYIYDRLTKERI